MTQQLWARAFGLVEFTSRVTWFTPERTRFTSSLIYLIEFPEPLKILISLCSLRKAYMGSRASSPNSFQEIMVFWIQRIPGIIINFKIEKWVIKFFGNICWPAFFFYSALYYTLNHQLINKGAVAIMIIRQDFYSSCLVNHLLPLHI